MAWFAGFSSKRPSRLPEAHGLKTIEIGCNSVYLRWSFLSTEINYLSSQQLNALIFEFRTMDKSLISECSFNKIPSRYEYKARLNGLEANTKYRFQIRCKLQYHQDMLYSAWSNRIEFKTKANEFCIITDEQHNNSQSLQHQLTDLQLKYKQVEIERDELRLKLKKFLPPHHDWDYKKIVEWIMRIEGGIFKRYKDTLYKHLKDENITGLDLKAVEEKDLRQFGISNFSHRKILMKHLSKLTENDKAPECLYDSDLARTITTPESILRAKSRFSQEDEEEPPPSMERLGTDGARRSLPKDQESKPTKMAFPKQTTHFNLPSDVPPDSGVDSDKQQDVDEDKDNDDELKEEDIVKALKLSDISSNYGLTKSVKNLLISSPSNEPPKKWKYKNGVLSVKVIKATSVDNMDTDEDASDPYVELEIKGHFRKEKTKVIYNDANPVWNERFQLFPENPKKDILKCKIWDKDTWTFDDKIGSVYIPVIDVLNANGYVNKAFDVRGSQTGAKLYLELKYKELEH